MVDYTPPNNDSVFFNFSEGGYQKPNFDSVDFNFSAAQFKDLQAAVEVSQYYYDTTYTYTKACRKIVVGYRDNGIQVIDLPCLFGGIRDFSSLIACKSLYVTEYQDFSSYTRVLYRLSSDIIAYTRAMYTGDLSFKTYSVAIYKGEYNLVAASRAKRDSSMSFSSFVRQSYGGSSTFFSYMKFVQGHAIAFDLSAILFDIQPKNIAAFLNVIEIKDLYLNIDGVYFKGVSTFYTEFNKVLFRSTKDIQSTLYGWAIKNLFSTIRAFWTKDLRADITSGFFAIHKNLNSLIYCVTPKDFLATLHGYAASDLNAFTIFGFFPNDLPAYIDIIKFVNLRVDIVGKLGLATILNLPSYISGVNIRDFSAYIDINAAKNLAAYIDAVGKYLDLTAKIAPRTINIKRMLFVPLLEHKDLKATIQYSCKGSGFREFSSYIYPIRNKDLKAYIIGWFSGTSDNIKDLAVHINYVSYCVQNVIELSGEGHSRRHTKLQLLLSKKQEYRIQDFYNLFGGSSHALLNAYIVGHYTSSDLKATLRARPIANFTAIPSWINPSTLEAVINLTRFEERWTRFVEMMFFTNSTEDFHYFYVSGENKIYKVDKKRTWRIHVTGYTESNDTLYRRTKVNKKFVFNLKNYRSVDEAVRDLIDRVTLFKSKNLAALITAYDLEHKNLYADINVARWSSWTNNLSINIKSKAYSYLSFLATITPKLYKDTNNLTVSIVGKSYEPQNASNIRFIFNEPGYSASAVYYNNINWTYKQAEEFWKDGS